MSTKNIESRLDASEDPDSLRLGRIISRLTAINAIGSQSPKKANANTGARKNANHAARVVAGLCVLGSSVSFAQDSSADFAAEIARLKQELEATKQENEMLKNALVGDEAENTSELSEEAELFATSTDADVTNEYVDDEPKALGEVVVQSRRREEKLQDVPLPVSVVGSEITKRDNIVTIHEITEKVPNLLFTASNARQTSIAIRGLGKNASDEARDPSVGVQVDNVPIIWPGSVFTNFVDLDHIELLRGPQGTLQGKNANLGLLNIVTKLPSWTSQHYIEGFAGNRDSLQGKVSSTGSIIDGLLAYRGSFYIDQRDGFVKNLDNPVTVGDLKETRRMGGRFQLLFTPTDTLSARVILDRASATNSQIADYNSADPATLTDGSLRTTSFSTRLSRDHFNINGKTFRPILGEPRIVQFDDIRPSRGDQQGASGEINWDIGGHTLTSISAYRWGLFEPHNDGDRSPFAISEIAGGTVEARQWSQEIRLTSHEPGFGFIDYQVGALALRTDNEVTSQTDYGADAGAFFASNAVYNRLSATPVGRLLMRDSLDDLLLTTTLNPTVTSLSAFGQADLHITDKATLTLGVRHTWEDRNNKSNKFFTTPHLQLDPSNPKYVGATARDFADALSIRGNGQSGGVLGNVYGQTDTFGFDQHSQNWLVNPSYKFNDNFMTYFSVAGGEKSGAILIDANGRPEEVDPEKVIDFELGFKSSWFDRKLFVNLNLYDTIVSDFQARITVEDSTQVSGFRTTTGNVKEIEMRGVELETTWNAYKGLNFYLNGSFNHAQYNDYSNAPCPPESRSRSCDFTGKTIPNAPRFTANFGFDYRYPLQVYGLVGKVFMTNAYRSRANMNADLSEFGIQEAYHVTGGGIGVSTGDGKYDLALVGRNIFDTDFITNSGSLSSTASARGTQGEARYFGVNFRANF